jgi:hypothetical protein
MSAAQLLADVGAVLRAPLHPNSIRLWLYVYTEGGEVSEQTRPEIGHELNLHPGTVTTAARELENAGWLDCVRGCDDAGVPFKLYRCLYPHRGGA